MISRVVDSWIDGILGRFVTKLTVDSIVSYNKREQSFFKGLPGKLLRSLNLWIKILLCEKGLLQMQTYYYLLMFRRSEEGTGTTCSQKRYIIETRKGSRGQDPKVFIGIDCSPLLSDYGSELDCFRGSE